MLSAKSCSKGAVRISAEAMSAPTWSWRYSRTRISRVFSTTPTAYTPTAIANATTSVRPRCSQRSIRTFAQGVVSKMYGNPTSHANWAALSRRGPHYTGEGVMRASDRCHVRGRASSGQVRLDFAALCTIIVPVLSVTAAGEQRLAFKESVYEHDLHPPGPDSQRDA